jgi:hypothetical protein
MRQLTGFNSLNHWFLWIIETKMFLHSQTWNFMHLIGWVSRSPPVHARLGEAGWGFQ